MLGPGILFAGAAIGVSHLVQSTRAGATYGFSLIWVLFFANLVKYPFFEFSPRYTAAADESVLAGYRRLGNWAVILYMLVTILSMFTIIAAVTMVTASIVSDMLGGGLSLIGYCIILIAVCIIILIFGHYKTLDRAVKWIVLILSISTIIAVVSAMTNTPLPTREAESIWTDSGILFLIALIGWMPTTLDIGVWQSVWIVEQKRSQEVPLKSALFDFNVGYFGAMILSFFFLTLGAMLMFNSGESFSPKGGEFAAQLIALYTASIGEWSKPIIYIAAFTTMFSTTLTCMDGFPRTLTHLRSLYKGDDHKQNRRTYIGLLIFIGGGSIVLISFFLSSLKAMVDFATILSCLITPVLAFVNYRLLISPHTPEHARPTGAYRIISIICFVLLLVLPGLFIYSQM